MAITDKKISALIASQLPAFINSKYAENAPSFRRFVELYYEWLEDETKGNTIYHIMSAERYRDVDETEEGFIRLFRNELLPYFPERTELEIEKILKGAKNFYKKKGTADSIEWLFRVLFNKEAQIFYPRDNILKASDGKWQLPQALKISQAPFLVQTAESTKNYKLPPIENGTYHSNVTYQSTATFASDFRYDSTILAYVSYKIWANTSADGNDLRNTIVSYITTDNPTSLTDDSGAVYTRLSAANAMISQDLTGYGTDLHCYHIIESFYKQNVNITATKLTFNNRMTNRALRSLLDESNVSLQFDGIRAFEFSDIKFDEPFVVETNFADGTLYSNTTLEVVTETVPNTPFYTIAFAKEEQGNAIVATESSEYVTLANTQFGSDRFTLVYSKKYIDTNVNTSFTLADSSTSNIAVISASFAEKTDIDIRSLEKRIVYGDISKARAVIEKVFDRVDEYTRTKYTELFISSIEGEFLNNELIYVIFENTAGDNIIFNERVLGLVNAIIINPNYRGLRYEPGYPAVIYGGFIDDLGRTPAAGFKFAEAEVETTTIGRITDLALTKGGYGYRADPNTTINVTRGFGDTTGTGAVVTHTVDTSSPINLSLATDVIAPYASVTLDTSPFDPTGVAYTGFASNTAADIDADLASCFTFINVAFYPISSLTLVEPGQEYSTTPVLSFNTFYQAASSNINIRNLGLISAVEVIEGGLGYANGEYLIFNGTDGPANAEIVVDGDGAITSVTINDRGYGYLSRPTVDVSSSGTGANLIAYLFNDGAEYEIAVDQVGAIQTMKMTNFGFGYISEPKVSLKVEDIGVSNISSSFTIDQGQVRVVQTSNAESDLSNTSDIFYSANVDMGYVIENAQSGAGIIRVFDYNGIVNVNNALIVVSTNTHIGVDNVTRYGNGLAKANLLFVDGTLTYPGYYLNTDGFVSSDKKLQNKYKYHNFSYVIESDQPYSKYKQTVYNVVHPSGMELIAHRRLSDVYRYPYAVAESTQKHFCIRTAVTVDATHVLDTDYYTGNTANIDLDRTYAYSLNANVGSFNTDIIAANDIVVINYDDPDRRIVTIANTVTSGYINVTQPIIIFGHGLLTSNDSVYVVSTENVENKIIANDVLRIFYQANSDVSTRVITVANVVDVINNTIELDTTVSGNNTNLGYIIDPYIINANLKIYADCITGYITLETGDLITVEDDTGALTLE